MHCISDLFIKECKSCSIMGLTTPHTNAQSRVKPSVSQLVIMGDVNLR